ncbi:MAG: hypothetical protein K6T73_07765 [Candidatus Bathyarchaeota archaeon]|nr:hypothetical protein [Candidatus Bathyarchaeota archaeon]
MFPNRWRKFLRSHLIPQQFPRDMFLNRAKVYSEEQYLKELCKNYLNGNCFISLYTDYQISQGIIDCIFLEIDAYTVEQAIRDCTQLVKALDGMNAQYRIYFSGRRGFHIYLEFTPVQLKHPRMSIKRFVESLPDCIDPHVIGNIEQLVRVPYTAHKKTGLFSFEVDPEKLSSMTSEEIFRNAVNPDNYDPLSEKLCIDYELAHKLKDIDEQLASSPKIELLIEHISKGEKEDPFPPCVISSLSALQETGQLDHSGRLLVASFMIKKGYSDKEICSLFAQYAKDYVESKTMYQLGKIRGGQMNCFSCRSLRRRGLCAYSVKDAPRCSWHPSINQFFSPSLVL